MHVAIPIPFLRCRVSIFTSIIAFANASARISIKTLNIHSMDASSSSNRIIGALGYPIAATSGTYSGFFGVGSRSSDDFCNSFRTGLWPSSYGPKKPPGSYSILSEHDASKLPPFASTSVFPLLHDKSFARAMMTL